MIEIKREKSETRKRKKAFDITKNCFQLIKDYRCYRY